MELQLPKLLKASISDDRCTNYQWRRVAADFAKKSRTYGMASTHGRLAFNERCIDVVKALTKIAISVISAGKSRLYSRNATHRHSKP